MLVWYAGGWDEVARCEDFISDMGDDVCVELEGELTFEIKLVDVFQRLVDKVETSKSLQEREKIICENLQIFKQWFQDICFQLFLQFPKYLFITFSCCSEKCDNAY